MYTPTPEASSAKKYIFGGLALAVVIALAVASYIFLFDREEAAVRFTELPACDAPISQKLLIQTFNEASFNKMNGISLTKIRKMESAKNNLGLADYNFCKASILTNDGIKETYHSIKWDNKEEVFVLLEIIDVNGQ